jgi:thioredoxin 1
MIKTIMLLTAAATVFAAVPAAHNELDLNNLAQRIGRQVDSASVLMNDGKTEDAQFLIQNAADDWGKYVEFHNYVADREFARTAKLDTLVAEVTGRFETALKGDLGAELPGLKERLSGLSLMANLPILADFSGNSCKNCKIMKTRLTAIASEYKGKVRIVYVNVNVERDLIKLYRVTLIPTLVFIGRDGKEASRFVGAMEENDLKKKLNDLQGK